MSKIDDWIYFAEGALNLTLRYVGEDERLKPYVLRLRKKRLLKADADFDAGVASNDFSNGFETVIENVKEEKKDPWNRVVQFCENTMLPLLGSQYVRLSYKVSLKKFDLRAIERKVFDDRPTHRRIIRQQRGMGETETETYDALNKHQRYGLLMMNCAKLPLPSNSPVVSPKALNICVEIKTKCGFLPTRSIVKQQIKAEISRYRLHQRLKNRKGNTKGVSNYDPLDLFSMERPRVVSALKSLMKHPQNNFRFFLNQQVICPKKAAPQSQPLSDSGSCSQTQSSEYLFDERLWPSELGSLDRFVDTLTDILLSESLLDKLRAAQMLDKLDIENVYIVFQFLMRNVNLVHNMLKTFTDLEMQIKSQELFETCRASIEKLDCCLTLLDLIITNNKSRQVYDSYRLFRSLSPESILLRCESFWSLSDFQTTFDENPPEETTILLDSIFILRDFLISKTAKDCSVMIVLQPKTTAANGEQGTQWTSSKVSSPSTKCKILCSDGLIAEYYTSKPVIRQIREYSYSVAIVDLDPKSVYRIPHYFRLDREICDSYVKSNQAEVQKSSHDPSSR